MPGGSNRSSRSRNDSPRVIQTRGFQRGKHGKRSELGYEVFFSTDGKQLFIEDVQVSAEASQGQQIFVDKLEQSEEGQTWSADAEFATGKILNKAEEKKVMLNTPPRQATSPGKFSKAEFVYDAEDGYVYLPAWSGVIAPRNVPQERRAALSA